MKFIVNHLAEVLITISAVALLIGVIMTFSGSLGNFFGGVLDKMEDSVTDGIGGDVTDENDTSMLSKPTLSLTGNTLIISPVKNATNYDVYADGVLVYTSSTTTVDLSALDLKAGNHAIVVRAKATGYNTSRESNSVVYTVKTTLSAPTISISDSILTISVVENAVNYDVYAEDVIVATVTATIVDLSALTLEPGSYDITVRAKATGYNTSAPSNSLSYTVSPVNQTLNFSVSGYTGIYDGNAHGITVVCDGANITYSDSENGTYSAAAPTYTDAGTYTVWYKIEKDGYDTVTGNEKVIINKASNTLILSATSGTLTYPATGTFTVETNVSGGALSVTSSDENILKASISGNVVTLTTGTVIGSATVTVTSEATANYTGTTATYAVTVMNGTLSGVSVSGYTGVYDGTAHSITVICDGANITYSDSENGTYSAVAPTYTNVGTYTVWYKIEKDGYDTVTGSEKVIINKASNTLILSATSGTLTYPATGTFTVETNVSGGALSVTSSNENILKASISGSVVTLTTGTTSGVVTITVTSAATTNYDSASITYSASVNKGILNVTATGYSGVYDGATHGITVTCDGATITYAETENGNYVAINPTYKDAGTYIVYYRVEKAGYETVSGSKMVVISKTDNTLSLSATSGTLTYPATGTFTVETNVSGGALSVISSNENILKASISGNVVTLTPGTTSGVVTITVTSAATMNYDSASITYSASVNKGILNVTATGYSGVYDGATHGITVTCDGATITYAETENGNYVAINPTYKDAGTYIVYYRVEKAGYETVLGSKTVVISKANNTLSLSATSGALTHPATGTFTVETNVSGGALSVTSSNEEFASASINGATVSISCGSSDGTAVITVTAAETTNYNAATATYTVTITIPHVAANGEIIDEWSQIISSVKDGSYKTKYSIGDYKELDLGSEGKIQMQIAAFDADVRSDGKGTAAITWIAKGLLETQHSMRTDNTNASGWGTSAMRTYLHNDIWARIPAELQASIVAVDKTYYRRLGDPTTVTSSDKLWVPSSREVLGYGNEDSGVVYSEIFTDSNSRIRTLPDGTASYWWLRTAHHSNVNTFWNVTSTGTTPNNPAGHEYGVLLCFCMG